MKYVTYLRSSTESQTNGIEAQRASVNAFAACEGSTIIKEFVEFESGKNNERPLMQEAIIYAQLQGAVLLVKTLDRISRDLGFIVALEKSQAEFKIVDMPTADSFTLHIYGSLAARERELISIRTKATLSMLKAKGVKLGKPENMTEAARADGRKASIAIRHTNAKRFADMIGPTIKRYQAEGLGLAVIAARLNDEGYKTRKGGKFYAATIQRLIAL